MLDNGSAHTSRLSTQALEARRRWLHVVWLAKYSPQLNPKEREWRRLKRDARSHLAADLRAFVDGILAGLRQLGGACCTIVDAVPQWVLEGHRKPPTGRPPGRPCPTIRSSVRSRGGAPRSWPPSGAADVARDS